MPRLRMGAVAIPARKGDIAVFSSLTPHRTGPNLTDEVRKSADGAGVAQDDPERQHRVV